MKITPSFGTFKVKNISYDDKESMKKMREDIFSSPGISECINNSEAPSEGDDMERAKSLDTKWSNRKAHFYTYMLTNHNNSPLVTAKPWKEEEIVENLEDRGYEIDYLTTKRQSTPALSGQHRPSQP